MLRYLLLVVFIGDYVISTTPGSVLEDEVLILQGAIDRQILFLKELDDRQGEVIALFEKIAKAFPPQEVVHVNSVESNVLTKLRKKLQERKQAHSETTVEPLPVEPTLDDLRALLIRELTHINIRPANIQTWLGLLTEQSGVIQDVEAGLQVIRTCQTILGFLLERVHSSDMILRLIPGITGLSKENRDSLNGPLMEYGKDAEMDVEIQTVIRDSVTSAVKALVQKERVLKSLDEQEAQRIMESFEIVDSPESEFDAIVVTKEEILEFESTISKRD